MKKRISKKLNNLDIHTIEVVKKSAASTLVKITGMIIGFLVSVALGRILGPEGLGIITLANTMLTLVSTIALVGMRQVIIKQVAIAFNKNNLQRVKNVMHTAYIFNGGISLFISVALILLSPWLATSVFNEPLLTVPLILAMAVLTPHVLSRIFSSGLIGYRKIWQSNLVDETLSVFVTGASLLVLWIIDFQITINVVAIIYAIGRVTVTIAIGTYWKSLNRFKLKGKSIAKELARSSFSLFMISISAIIVSQATILILGRFSSSSEIGLYSVAARLALLSSFLLVVTSSTVAPKVAALFQEGKKKEMEKMIQQVTKGLSLIGGLPLIIFLFFGESILNIWGNEFVEAYWILIILSIGQLINLGTGAVGQIMIMTGHEKVQSQISIIVAILSVIVNIILIIFFGAIGAAIGTAIILAGSNIAKVIYVKKLVGINVLSFKF